MSALSDAEVLSALPVETRKRIDSAFEALSQSLPTDKERLILYRVAHALKLNPTDTHFSIMAAMHYYLQLYQMIPDKIINAGGKIIEAGNEVDQAIRKATRETLVEHANALDAKSEYFARKIESDQLALLAHATERIADDMAAHGRQQSLAFATAGTTVGALVFYLSGLLVAGSSLGIASASGAALAVGLIIGGLMAHHAFPKDVVHHLQPDSDISDSVGFTSWSETQFQQAASRTRLSNRTLLSCRDVLMNGYTLAAAEAKQQIAGSQIARGIKELNKYKQ